MNFGLFALRISTLACLCGNILCRVLKCWQQRIMRCKFTQSDVNPFTCVRYLCREREIIRLITFAYAFAQWEWHGERFCADLCWLGEMISLEVIVIRFFNAQALIYVHKYIWTAIPIVGTKFVRRSLRFSLAIGGNQWHNLLQIVIPIIPSKLKSIKNVLKFAFNIFLYNIIQRTAVAANDIRQPEWG